MELFRCSRLGPFFFAFLVTISLQTDVDRTGYLWQGAGWEEAPFSVEQLAYIDRLIAARHAEQSNPLVSIETTESGLPASSSSDSGES